MKTEQKRRHLQNAGMNNAQNPLNDYILSSAIVL